MSKHSETASVAQQQAPNNGDSIENPVGETPTAKPQREANGQFAAGNNGGPGNPFGRKTAARRKAILEAIDDATVREIMLTLARLAIAGDVDAAKLVLQYVVGKPVAVVEPDRVHVDEWKLQKDSFVYGPEFDNVKGGIPVHAANALVEALVPAKVEQMAAMARGDLVWDDETQELLTREEAADRDELEREVEEQLERRLAEEFELRQRLEREAAENEAMEGARPSTNGGNGYDRPLPNGANGGESPLPNGRNGAYRPSTNGRNGHHRRPHGERNGR